MMIGSKYRKGIFKGVVFLFTTGLSFWVITYSIKHANTSEVMLSPAPAPNASRPVTIVNVTPHEVQANVNALGEVVPEWQTALRAQVRGEIIEISKRLKPGAMVKKGEVLVILDQSEYRMRLAEAKARLSEANLNLLKEKHEAEEAQINWQRSGLKGEPDSDLAHRKPQLEVRRAEVSAAEKALERASRELFFTSIRAPFDGLVVSRSVAPGASLLAGEEVAVIIGINRAEVAVHLDSRQWKLLPDQWKGIEATLIDPSNGNHWSAVAVRDGGYLDRKSRLRTLYLEVDRPYELTPALLPGTFVQVHIVGRTITSMLRIPESALTRKGVVWYVDENETLRCFHATPVFYRDGDVFLHAPHNLAFPVRICLMPNNSFLVGTSVVPVINTSQG